MKEDLINKMNQGDRNTKARRSGYKFSGYPFWQTLADAFDTWVRKYSEKEAISFKKQRITYKELGKNVSELARGLVALGVGKGKKVGLWMPNCIDWIYAFFAIAKTGATIVPLSTRFKTLELETVLKHGEIDTLIFVDKFLKFDCIGMVYDLCAELKNSGFSNEVCLEQFPMLKRLICISEKKYDGCFSYGEVKSEFSKLVTDGVLRERQREILPDDDISIIYTSGTTGIPKGVVQVNGAVVKKGFDRARLYGFTENDRLLLSVSLYTQWGCNALLTSHLTHGVSIIIQEYFEAEEALKLIAAEKCSIFSGTPTHYRMLLEVQDFDKYDVSSLRYANISGERVADNFYKLIMKKFSACQIITGYGLTETTGLVTGTQKDDPLEKRFQTIGAMFPDIEMKVVCPDSGEELLSGVDGEICTRGYHLMRGYYKRPGDTAKTIDKDGWLHTGDIGRRLKDGNWVFCGRIKDMVRSGGFNIFAQDIEEFISRYPKVKNVAVVGVADERMDEVVGAIIQVRENMLCTEAEIIEFCKSSLSNYKVPKYILFVKDDFPLSTTGKVQKQKLKLALEEKLFK